jgi:hypothetical protein
VLGGNGGNGNGGTGGIGATPPTFLPGNGGNGGNGGDGGNGGVGVPTVTPISATVSATASETFAGSALFAPSDAAGAPIVSYQVEDQSTGTSQGFWVLNGAVLLSGQITTLSAAQLSQLSFVAGANASASVSDTLEVAASDSAGFGAFAAFTVMASKFAPGDVAPTVTAAGVREAPGLNLAASGLFSASAAQGETVTSYEVEDTTSGSGHWVFNGVVEPANQLIDVSAAQLSELSFATGYGTDALMVRANDGSQWGSFTTFTVAPPANAAAPSGTSADMIMRDSNGDYEIYDLGNDAILAAGPLGQVDPAWQVAGIGGFDGTDASDMILRNSATGAFEIADISNNNMTNSIVAMGQVGLEWQVAGFGDFSSRAGETDMLMRNRNTGQFEVYDISNNAITSAAPLGQVGLEWQVAGFGDFSGHANETDMLMRNTSTGQFEVYDIGNNQIISAGPMGQVGLEWQVAGFGDFSGYPNETDMLMRNGATGAFEIYDIRNNSIASASPLGPVGLEWQVAGFGDFSGNANETDMLMRNSATGAFEVYDISNNAITNAAPMGQVGTEWSVAGIAANPPGGASAANSQLVQAMAAFGSAGGTVDSSAFLGGAATEQNSATLFAAQGQRPNAT